MPLVPLLTNSGPTASLYAPASVTGGGGGSGNGSTISNQYAFVTVSSSGSIVMGQTNATASSYDIQVGNSNTVGINIGNGTGDLIGLFNGAITINTSTINIAALSTIISNDLNVSSINGQAPGGGGGGAGPNPQVSTLSFGVGNETTSGVINISTSLTINDPTTLVNQDFEFNTQLNADPYTGSTVNTFLINGPGGNANNGSFFFTASANGDCYILAENAGGTAAQQLAIYASTLIVPGPLQAPCLVGVSSINGAAPGGGGGGPNLQVSTVSFPSGVALPSTGLYTPDELYINNPSTLAINDIVFGTAAEGFPYVGVSTNYVQVVSPSGTGSDILLAAGDNGTTYLRAYNDNTNVPTGIVVEASSMTVSSLWISSLNGVLPSLYPVVSTIKPGGGGGTQTQYFISTGQNAQVLTAFSTLVGHNYQLTIPFAVSTFATPVYGDAIDFTATGVGGGGSDYSYTLPLIQGGSYSFPISFKNKVADGGMAVILTANTSYAIEVNLGDSEGGVLVDLGPSI